MGNLMAPADPNPHNIFIDIHDLSRRQIFVLKFQVHLGLFFVLIAVASATCSTNRSSIDDKGNSQSDRVTLHNWNLTIFSKNMFWFEKELLLFQKGMFRFHFPSYRGMFSKTNSRSRSNIDSIWQHTQ